MRSTGPYPLLIDQPLNRPVVPTLPSPAPHVVVTLLTPPVPPALPPPEMLAPQANLPPSILAFLIPQANLLPQPPPDDPQLLGNSEGSQTRSFRLHGGQQNVGP